ncbi:hypothetical protein GCM10010193_69820 [Kitasatospora atroaurantiaca]|uniref:Uncharacterized protein n=1 Tax=Kitasatospora atroaurantiaca TaxID=285545 RepID=A0A561EN76_9ACTN|nr:hypothetical protein [Kitasatospora atroaurantiaca]TWE17068.1 hypothetical protein FB465_2072 [Kitasatospora atroaurantiaca]
MPDLSPAETLTTAAKLLRERATAITAPDPGLDQPWHVEECADNETGGCPCIVAYQQHDDSSGFGVTTRYVADAETPEFAQWIALMNPGVGLALADWLDVAAANAAALTWPNQFIDSALAVARQILGEVTE